MAGMSTSDRIEFIVLQQILSDYGADEETSLRLWDRLEELWSQSIGDDVEYAREPVRLWLK